MNTSLAAALAATEEKARDLRQRGALGAPLPVAELEAIETRLEGPEVFGEDDSLLQIGNGLQAPTYYL